MITDPVTIIPCPICGQRFRKKSPSNKYRIKSELWSDGKKISPLLPEYPWLVKCNNCGKLFYADEAFAIQSINHEGVDYTNWDNVAYFDSPSFEEYFEALGTDVFEKYLRWEALHCYNDLIRNNKENVITEDMQDLYSDNLKTLLYFLSEDDPEELFMIVEINRQLGKFEKCMNLMKKADNKKHKAIRNIFLREIENKNTKLFQIY